MVAVAATAVTTGLLLGSSASPRTRHFGFAILESLLSILYRSWDILSGVRFGFLFGGALRRHAVTMFGDIGLKMIMTSRQNAVHTKMIVSTPSMN